MSLILNSVTNKSYIENKLEIMIEGKLNGVTRAVIPHFNLYIFPDCSGPGPTDVLVNNFEDLSMQSNLDDTFLIGQDTDFKSWSIPEAVFNPTFADDTEICPITLNIVSNMV